MQEKLKAIREEALKAIEQADMPEKLNDVRVKFLGKKGELTAVLKSMKDVAKEDRPKVGQMVNETREAIEKILEESKSKMERAIREEKMKAGSNRCNTAVQEEYGRTQTSEHDCTGRSRENFRWYGI